MKAKGGGRSSGSEKGKAKGNRQGKDVKGPQEKNTGRILFIKNKKKYCGFDERNGSEQEPTSGNCQYKYSRCILRLKEGLGVKGKWQKRRMRGKNKGKTGGFPLQ